MTNLVKYSKKNNIHLVQPYRADEDDDSASRSYKIVHQGDVLDKLKSTLKISAQTMSEMVSRRCQFSIVQSHCIGKEHIQSGSQEYTGLIL